MTPSAAGRPPPLDEPPANGIDPLALYSRALHAYTLRLWTESLKAVEERRRDRVAQNERPDPTKPTKLSTRPPAATAIISRYGDTPLEHSHAPACRRLYIPTPPGDRDRDLYYLRHSLALLWTRCNL
ncbi:hypothetical protein B0H17DRAFT_1217255 [Mycena rosella]|uniref:Uncharacterized protein n=1 Tax=Mycena rosella TaxID=1033263 RepID=A0AAD7FSZ0_MYCRO|nr:hypothetical protein B0H17DRAFT_1217255 [Mycena rosella]